MRIFSETFNTFRMKQQKRLNELYFGIKHEEILNLRYVGSCPKLYVGQHEKNNLGAYHHDTKTITLSPRLVTMKQEVIDEILLHELAHYFQFLKYNRRSKYLQSHGKEFKEMCAYIGIEDSAKMNLKNTNEEAKASLKEEGLLAKVEKLLALGESSNEAESQSAIAKANDLIQKYNLQYIGRDIDTVYQKTVYTGKTRGAIPSAIANLCSELFDVHPVWGRFGDPVSLEFNGTEEKVEVASYVFEFVQLEVERFYKRARKEHGLSGRTAKINYIEGLLKAYIESAKVTNQVPEEEMTEDDVLMENALVATKQKEYNLMSSMVYNGRLKKTYSSRRSDPNARKAGQSDSSKFSINKGVNSKGGQKMLA